MAQIATTEYDHMPAQDENSPLFLVLGRKGLVDTELRNPYTDEVVYRIRDTGRGTLSSKPDYEIFRTSPAGQELFVGTIRFNKTGGTELGLPLTGAKSKGDHEKVQLKNVKGNGTTGSQYVWNTVKSKRKVVRDRWTETNDDGRMEIHTKEEVIVLELVRAAAAAGTGAGGQQKEEGNDPVAVVRLYNTQPSGRFEIWARDAWVFAGGDWNALDEIVVSAYANMEKAKRELMKGLDPSSWRGAAFAA